MKSRNYWFFGEFVSILFIVVPLLSAVITATGAFGADPGKPVNRMDFLWAAVGLAIITICFYRARLVKNN